MDETAVYFFIIGSNFFGIKLWWKNLLYLEKKLTEKYYYSEL